MFNHEMTDYDRMILSEALPECKERKEGWIRITSAIICMLDSFRIRHRKFTVHGVTFERVDIDEYSQYVSVKKGNKEWKGSWMLPIVMFGLYVDPERCDF